MVILTHPTLVETWNHKVDLIHKQLPFYFYVYFEGSPPAEEPYRVMPGELPIFICSHIPMEIFLFCETGKKWENQKSVVCARGGSCTCVFSWGSETPSGAPPLGECTGAGTSPTTCVDSWVKALRPTVVKAMLGCSAYERKKGTRCLLHISSNVIGNVYCTFLRTCVRTQVS